MQVYGIIYYPDSKEFFGPKRSALARLADSIKVSNSLEPFDRNLGEYEGDLNIDDRLQRFDCCLPRIPYARAKTLGSL
jgi:hypothetical protein